MIKFSGIRQQILLVALVPILVITLLLGGYSIFARFSDAERALIENSKTVTHQLASSSEYAVFSGNITLLKQAIMATFIQTDVHSVRIVDKENRQLIAENRENTSVEAEPDRVNSANPIFQDNKVLEIYEPIFATEIKLNELDESNDAGHTEALGAVIITFSKINLQRQYIEMLSINLTVMAVVLLISLLAALWLARRLSKPILDMGYIIHKIGIGNLHIRIPQQHTVHELNEFAHTINNMAQQLSEERNTLEIRIQNATQDLHNKSQRLLEKNEEAAQAHQAVTRLNEKLSFALNELETIIEANPDLLYVFNTKGQLIKWNTNIEKFFGLTKTQLMNKSVFDFFCIEDRSCIDDWMHKILTSGSATVDARCVGHDGKLIPFQCNGVTLKSPDGEIIGFTGTGRDITERILAAERMQQMAHYDMLTNLPNRALFSDRLRQAFTNAKRYKGRMALLYIDLDRFKHINDTFGHKAGDQLLKDVTQGMLGCVRDSDTVARIGGDEFLVLLPAIDKQEEVMQVAEKIRHILCQPLQLGSNTVYISCSIGISFYPEHGVSEEDLINHADDAMYVAKAAGRNIVQLYRE